MNLKKYLVFGISFSCISGIVNPSIAIAGAPSFELDAEIEKKISAPKEKEDGAYDAFLKKVVSVTRKTGFIDLTGIDLEKMSDIGFRNIKRTIEYILHDYELNSSKYSQAGDSENKLKVLLSPANSEITKSNKVGELHTLITNLKPNGTIILPTDTGNLNKVLTATKTNTTLNEESKIAKKTGLLNLTDKSVRINIANPSDLLVMKSKIAGLTTQETEKVPIVLLRTSNSNSQNFAEKFSEISDVCKNNNVDVYLASEINCFQEIEHAINMAYDTNIIDLRCLKDYDLADYEIEKLIHDFEGFANDYRFDRGPVEILISIAALRAKRKYVTNLQTFVDEHERFRLNKDPTFDCHAYDKYIENVINVAKTTKILDLTGIFWNNFTKDERERHIKSIADAIKNKANVKAIYLYDSSTRFLGELHQGMVISQFTGNTTDSSDSNLITEVAQYCQEVQGVRCGMKYALMKKLNHCYGINKITIGKISKPLGELLKAKIALRNLTDSKPAKGKKSKTENNLVLYGMFEEHNEKTKMGCEAHDCNEQLFRYVDEKVQDAYTTNVIDLSNINYENFTNETKIIGLRGFLKNKFENDINMIISRVAELLRDNTKEGVTSLIVYLSKDKKYTDIATKLKSSLEDLGKKFKNLRIYTIDG